MMWFLFGFAVVGGAINAYTLGQWPAVSMWLLGVGLVIIICNGGAE